MIVGAYGQTDNPAATQRAFTWHAGALRILPRLSGGRGTYARRINARGEIAGDAFTPTGTTMPSSGTPAGFTTSAYRPATPTAT